MYIFLIYSEIKEVKRKKARAKELEGIDLSNIVSSSRRRSTSSYTSPPPPKPKVPVETSGNGAECSDNDDEDNDNEEDEGVLINMSSPFSDGFEDSPSLDSISSNSLISCSSRLFSGTCLTFL